MNRLPESVNQKFNELFAVIGKAGDDLKIATAEAAMIGNFAQVSVGSENCLRLQSLEMEIKACLAQFESELKQPTAKKFHHNDPYRTRKSGCRLRVTIAGKVIEENTIAETFVKTLRESTEEYLKNIFKISNGKDKAIISELLRSLDLDKQLEKANRELEEKNKKLENAKKEWLFRTCRGNPQYLVIRKQDPAPLDIQPNMLE